MTGKIGAFGRFISRSSERRYKSFSVLKKHKDFEWTREFQQALKDLLNYLVNPPLLLKHGEIEKFLIYLAVSKISVSAIIAREDKYT